jgi:hypothetical protein
MRFFSFFKRFLLDRVPRVCDDHNVARRLVVKKVALTLLLVFALLGDGPRARLAKTNLAAPLPTPAAAAAINNTH